MIERLRWREILPHFKRLETNSLDTAAAASGGRASPRAFSSTDTPPKLLASTTSNATVLLAQAPVPDSPAFILDYTTVTCSGGICNGYRFEPNRTYYISGPVTIQNETVLSGGTIIKMNDQESGATIDIAGSIRCDTGPGAPRTHHIQA